MQLALALLLLLARPQDSVRVQATLSAHQIAVGVTTVLAIEVETSGSTPDALPVPVLPPGLDLGPITDFSRQQVAFPGGSRRITRREVVVIATAPGSYRIPAIEVRVGQRTLRTRELGLVVAGLDPGGQGAAPTAVQLRAWARPDTVFVGQQLRYEAEAVLPEELRLRQTRAPDFEPPVATGFWTFSLPEPVTVSLRTSGSVTSEVQTFRQLLFPLAVGELAIPPARLQYEIRRGPVNPPELHALATGPVTITVLPLPTGAPTAFGGAVGSFTISAALSTATAKPDEAVRLRLTIEGSGNIKALTRPTLDTIPGVDVLESAELQEIGFADGHMSGRRTFDWLLVPRQAGPVEVPAIEYAWFEPSPGQYHLASTSPLELRVLTAGAGVVGEGGLSPIRLTSGPAPVDWALSPGFAALQLLPALGLLAIIFAGHRRRGRTNRLPELEQLPGPAAVERPRECLEQLAGWLRSQPATPAIMDLRQRVSQALYAPREPTGADCEELLRSARNLAGQRSLGGRRGRAVHGLLLATITLSLGPSDSDAFQRGVTAYQAGAFETANEAFAAQTVNQPGDFAAWYNLGNAAFRSGQPGRAVWAWLRALELRPRDAWARHNLRTAGAREAERTLAPRVPLASSEVAALAALLWWIVAGLLAAGLLRPARRRKLLATASASLILLLPLLALLLARNRRPERALTLEPAALLSAPALRADSVRALPAGSPLVVRTGRGQWLLVRTPDLRDGWIEARAVARL